MGKRLTYHAGVVKGGRDLTVPAASVSKGTRRARGVVRLVRSSLYHRAPSILGGDHLPEVPTDPDLLIHCAMGGEADETVRVKRLCQVLDCDTGDYLEVYGWLCEYMPQTKATMPWQEAYQRLTRLMRDKKIVTGKAAGMVAKTYTPQPRLHPDHLETLAKEGRSLLGERQCMVKRLKVKNDDKG